MAYEFVAANSQAIEGAISSIGRPVTLFGRFYADTTWPNPGTVVSINTTGGTRENAAIETSVASGANKLNYRAGAPGGVGITVLGVSGTTGNWYAGTGVDASNTSHRIYFENDTALATGVYSALSNNNFSIGLNRDAAVRGYWNGRLAEIAIWSVALSADDVRSLVAGFKPNRVRPQSLVYYVPLIREIQEIKSALNLTASASAPTAIAHPRVY